MKIAFITNGEVFHVQDTSFFLHKDKEEGFMSNPIFIDVTDRIDVERGDFYENGNFYKATDIEKLNPVQERPATIPNLVYIAFVANGVVFSSSTFKTDEEFGQRFSAGLLSNPICMDVTNMPEVQTGWQWNGEIFIPPMEG